MGRNEYILDCGDTLMRNVLFWMMQLPLGRAFSIDAVLDPEPLPPKVLPNEVVLNLLCMKRRLTHS